MIYSLIKNLQFQRISTNYLKMIATLALGIYLVRLLLEFGTDVYAAVVLIGSSIGIAAILKEMVRGATIPELGISFHEKGRPNFLSTYASSILLAISAGVFSILVLGLFYLFLDKFNVAEELRQSTRVLILTRMVVTFVSISVSPITNMLPITGRMASINFWLAMERVAEVGSAAVVTYYFANASGAQQLYWFAIFSMIAMTLTTLVAALYTIGKNQAFVPDFSKVTRARLAKVFHSVGWNGAAVVSVNLYIRFDIFAVNILFGIGPTVIFGIASQLATYTRQVTMGLITGLDAVVTKKTARKDEDGRLGILAISARTFELQSISLFAAGLILLLHGEYLINLWVGTRLDNPGTAIPQIVTIFGFLMVGMIARGLSEGWMSILAGSGKIKDYGLPVLIGALLNPIIVIGLYFILPIQSSFMAVAITFMILNIIFHTGILPMITARFLKVSLYELFKPAFVPFLLCLVCAAALVALHMTISNDLAKFVATTLVTGTVMGTFFLKSFLKLLGSEQDTQE